MIVESNDHVVLQFPRSEAEENKEFEEKVSGAKKLFSAHSGIANMRKMKDQMMSKRVSVLGSADLSDMLEQKIENLTITQLKKMKDEEIDQLFKLEDGGEIEISLDIKGKDLHNFKRDFLLFLKESSTANKALDDQIDRLEKDIKDHEDELNTLLDQYGDLDTFITEHLKKEHETATGSRKERLGTMIQARIDCFQFEWLKSHYTDHGTFTTLSDLKHNSDAVYAKYMKVVRSVGVTADITQFDNLETKFLPEKYHKWPNLFLFSIIKYIAYRKDKATRDWDGVLLTQLVVYLKYLFGNTFKSEDLKQAFIKNICDVLDVFYQE